MLRTWLFLSALPLAVCPPLTHAQDLVAYVTRAGSASDFDVDGLHTVLAPAVVFESERDKERAPLATPAPFVGQLARVWGHVDRKALTVTPTRIVLLEPRPYVVHGSAVIDQISTATKEYHRVRADGRMLEISNSILDHPVPLYAGAPAPATTDDLRTNVWIDHHGQRRGDGVVDLDQASFFDNAVPRGEEKLRESREYDPAAVPEDSHQSTASRFFRGVDVKQIPPYRDEAMQARVNRIGASLVPAYQRALPPSDPTRVNLRFQLVDQPKWGDAIALPSGIILVPRHIPERLADDSELAAVLADNMATAIEKQSFRQIGARREMLAAQVAADAGAFFVPGLGLAAVLANGGVGKHMLTNAEKQSGRVALAYMYDAGYDIDKAPEAWWILASKPGANPHSHPPPARAQNQFDELGTSWQPANRHRATQGAAPSLTAARRSVDNLE